VNPTQSLNCLRIHPANLICLAYWRRPAISANTIGFVNVHILNRQSNAFSIKKISSLASEIAAQLLYIRFHICSVGDPLNFGADPLTNGSGRPQNIRILLVRIRIRNIGTIHHSSKIKSHKEVSEQ